jgi:hypothetical protein
MSAANYESVMSFTFLCGRDSWPTTLTEEFKRNSAKTNSSGNYADLKNTKLEFQDITQNLHN